MKGNCPVPAIRHSEIVMAHGSGGRASRELLEKVILPRFRDVAPHDGARLPTGLGRMAYTTDSYVVRPLFFPGGDIGKLAVNGTLNDLAMCGARPQWLSVGLILEEGLPMGDFERVLDSMAETAAEAGVGVVTGDTKVVDRGKGDGLYLNTSGIGLVMEGLEIGLHRVAPGDRILVNGPIAAHGMAIMAVREGLAFQSEIRSDCASLAGLVRELEPLGLDLRLLRDPTRGGVASALTEVAREAGVGIELEEAAIPVASEVQGACEILGLDPLHVANEGKLLAVVAEHRAEEALRRMRHHPLGAEAAMIGEIIPEPAGQLQLRTRIGGTRLVELPSGELLPRIC